MKKFFLFLPIACWVVSYTQVHAIGQGPTCEFIGKLQSAEFLHIEQPPFGENPISDDFISEPTPVYRIKLSVSRSTPMFQDAEGCREFQPGSIIEKVGYYETAGDFVGKHVVIRVFSYPTGLSFEREATFSDRYRIPAFQPKFFLLTFASLILVSVSGFIFLKLGKKP